MKILEKYYDHKKQRYVYKIFGIKICVNNEYSKLHKRVDEMYKFLNYLVDVRNLPKAKGFLRSAQLKSVEVLKEVDDICKANNLKYWLDFGTLLGAVRHKGFIPWDDDIDICMLRDDYEKILPLLKEKFNDSDFYVRERAECSNNFQIRIRNDLKNYGVDIFPVDKYITDTYSDSIRKEIRIKTEKALKNFNSKYKCVNKSDINVKQAKQDLRQLSEKYKLIDRFNELKSPVLFYGIDFPHEWVHRCFSWNEIFPLSSIEFEGYQFLCPNQFIEHLTEIYGNWEELPTSFENLELFWE